MNLATMRTQFQAATGGLAGALSDSDIDVELNRFYEYVVPTDVDGALSDRLLQGACTTVVPFVSVPSWVVSLNDSSAWIVDNGSNHFLSIFSDWGEFTLRYPDPTANTGRPQAALLSQKGVIYWDVVPDAEYLYNIECRGGPGSGLTAAGLDDEIHALCVVHGAAWHYLLGSEDEAGAAREGARYDVFRDLLRTRSTSYVRRRMPQRSY